MGYQYIRHRCSNAAWARVVSLRAAASTTDQCVVTKAGASGTSSDLLLSLAAIDLTLAKSAQTLQEINWTAASGAGFSLTRLSHLADDQADCREQDRGSYDFEMFPGLSFPLCLSLSLSYFCQSSEQVSLLTLLDAPDFTRLATGNPKSGPALPPGERRKPWRRQAPPFPESVIHRELAFQAQIPRPSRQRVLANQLRRDSQAPTRS